MVKLNDKHCSYLLIDVFIISSFILAAQKAQVSFRSLLPPCKFKYDNDFTGSKAMLHSLQVDKP